MRQALRQLARSPGFVILAILTLALGIGFSASSFSLSNALLLRNLPYPHADRLVRIFATSPQSTKGLHTPGNIIAAREAAKAFSQFSIYYPTAYSLNQPGQPPEEVFVMGVTTDFFDMIGVHPTLGRGFTRSENQAGRAQVAVLTHRGWLRYFGGDRGVVGRTIRMNSGSYTIVGVLPKRFDASAVWGPVDVIVPMTLFPALRTNFDNAWMEAVARLKPSLSIQQAQAELNTIAARLRHDHPNVDARIGFRVAPLHSATIGDVSRDLLWLMMGLSLAMLLIACVNLASLQVARAFARTREFALRAALGGTRLHLMAPLLFESFLLALVGGMGGLLVAAWSNDLLGRFLMVGHQVGFKIPIDGRVFAFAVSASLFSGLAFGLAPAWLASRSSAAEVLKEGSRSSSGSRSQHRLKQALVVCEFALALALVGVAGAFGLGARSFLHRDVGWDINGLFSGSVALQVTSYPNNEDVFKFDRAVLSRLKAIPGIEHAALAHWLPLNGYHNSQSITVEGRSSYNRGAGPTAETDSVSPGFFAALRIPLKEGKLFTDRLSASDQSVAVVNEAFARRFWPDGTAVGRRIKLGHGQHWVEVIGVVGNIKMAERLGVAGTRFQVYLPLVQYPARYLQVIVRTKLAPEGFARSVRVAVAAVDPNMPVADGGSVRASFDRAMHQLNLFVINLGISAVMGLLIAAIGLFGVISQLTAQRTREIGVRMALGAEAGEIRWMILFEGIRLFAAGVVFGIPAYFALVVILGHSVPAMPLPGYWLLGVNVAVFAAATLLASFLPARRASRINPVEALRAE